MCRLQGDLTAVSNCFEKNKITPYETAEGWILNGIGGCNISTEYSLVKYSVVGISRLYLKIPKTTTQYNTGVYQFQNDTSVPSGDNPYVVGDPVSNDVNGIVEVPNGATYLIISKKDGDDSIIVESVKTVEETSEESIRTSLEKLPSYNYVVPSYYEQHLLNKIPSIRNNMMEVGKNGETFIFITDIHWDNNDRNSPALINDIRKHLNIDIIVCGGDLINEGEKEAMASNMVDCVRAFSFPNSFFPCAFGNHDSNKNNQGSMEDRWFSDNDIYALMYKQNSNNVKYLNDTDKSFYFDNETTKTRFIVIDSGVNGVFANQTVFTSLINSMLSVAENWKIVMVCHWLNNNAWYQIYYDLSTAINAYNSRTSASISTVSKTYDLSTAKGEVVLLLGGHMHKDMDTTTNNGSVPVVLTDSDNGTRSDNTDYPYIKETLTEQCFDVITIDYESRKIKAVRIGRGADREWIY